MKTPNWQKSFKNLPVIPDYKRWIEGYHFTQEQQISFKILTSKSATSYETFVLNSLAKYYNELNISLRKLDYTLFNPEDHSNFKNYINYAFNFTPLISNQLTVYATFRLIVNEEVLGSDTSVDHSKYLKYPSLDIVRKINKYGRSNSPESNVFYSAETINAALKETRPPLNKKVTIGVWKPIIPETELVSYPISGFNKAYGKNRGATKATNVTVKMKDNMHPSLFGMFFNYFELLGREYAKPVIHHNEYMISSLFSEEIFAINDTNPKFTYDCIIYPSVGSEYSTSNLAIRPSSFDKMFFLQKAIEFEIIESFYDSPIPLTDPESFDLIKMKKLRETTQIDKNGNIKW